ncbi:MAG: rod-binding protein [Planctomycetota bacterium]
MVEPIDRLHATAARETERLQRREVFEQFEAIFARELVRDMQRTVSEDGLFGEMPGSGIYEGLVEGVLSEMLARNGALGIADTLERAWEERYGTDA